MVGAAAAGRPKLDPIAEAYLRQPSQTAERRVRDRVDWIVACARGPRILDLNCGEGILARLLARAGHQVLGIDVAPAAIAAARDLMGSEPPDVRARIELRVADTESAELDENGFDTVVLDHLDEPAKILERAAALLKRDGRLILSAPFDHFPHPDHGREFRATELVNLLTVHFVIDDLTVVHRHFCVIAHALSAPVLQERRGPDLYQLLVATEEAAAASQRHLHTQMQHLQRQLALKRDLMQEALRRLAGTVEKERMAAEKIRRLERQLEHQKRVTAIAQSRLEQAQIRLKHTQNGLQQQLGRAVEKSLGSPLGVLRLLFRIVKVYRRARRSTERGRLAPSSPNEPHKETTAGVIRSKTRSEPDQAPPHRDISSAFPPECLSDRTPRSPLRVAAILDEFSDACFRYEAELVRVTKEGWRAQIERDPPAFLFVESAWLGNRGNWRRLIKNADETPDNPLGEIVDYCKVRGIPTVFWSKEDPPNLEHFIDAAAKFDYVFTTDANCIERYRERLGHERIRALPFAGQPAIHNPIGKQECDDYEVAFAGTWYGQKHEERGALLPILLDAAVHHKLHIFDRMSQHTRNDFYRFPEKYDAYLRTALPYPKMLSAYRNFKVFLNVNSVTDSPTMFARRVFEILASSTAVVSTASVGIERMLGDVVSLVHDEDEARAEVNKLLSDPIYRQRKAHLGYRKVMREHTYAARFRTIARTIGLDLDALPDTPEVSVVVPLTDERHVENALANVRRQRHARIEPVWALGGGASCLAERLARELPQGRTVEVGETSLAAMLRCGIEAARGALVTVFDPRDLYGPEFIGDLILAMTYANADVVGKAAHFAAPAPGRPPALRGPSFCYRYVDEITGAAWLARREDLLRVGIDQVLYVEHGRPVLVRDGAAGRIYSADPYNYLRFGDTDGTPESAAVLGARDLEQLARGGVII